MEKKFILAIVLSFMVLYVWSALTPRPKRPPSSPEFSQIADNKQVESAPMGIVSEKTSISDEMAMGEAVNMAVSETAPLSDESVEVVETNSLMAYLTNYGGNIKKISLKEFNHSLPVTNLINLKGYENVLFELDEHARNFISYSHVGDEFRVVKRYHLSNDGYSISSELEITNITDMSKLIDISLDNFMIDMSNLKGNNQRYNMLYEYSVAEEENIERKRNAYKFNDKEIKLERKNIKWIGFRDQYFCMVIAHDFENSHYYIDKVEAKRLNLGVKANEIRIEPGNKTTFKSSIYYGPQDRHELKKFKLGTEKIVNFKAGGFIDFMAFGMTDPIAKIMQGLLEFLHKIIPNWGVSIILFAFVIFGISYPMTYKMMSSMKKMQAIQPELAKLKEKHKDNPQKLNKDMMELYKVNKVNPLGGCLPMFFQMPIFISLYQLLWRSYILKGASFLWIKDLTEPDRLIILPFSLPFMGNEFNILPILYGIMMFFQQKFSQKNMASMDPTQMEMQKIMAKIFPVLLAVIFYKFASGLTLYFTVYFMLTTISQWKMSKQTKVV